MAANKSHVIKSIIPDSPCDKAGLKVGDILLEIGGEEVVDIFDYRYNILSSHIDLKVQRGDDELEFSIDKDEDEDPGLEFESGLMDEYRRCKNNCIFCFIDQMPKGMRETLYFKDDDSRLSFLQGNYVTLTNLSERDVDRIIRFKMEPINISFQTTNPELRCKMLNNRFAGEALKIADRLYEAGVTMNGQIVLCKGVNDGEELVRSIRDLSKYAPVLESVSVVPVGLTKFREGLYPLEPFTAEDAARTIDLIEGFQREFYDRFGLHFVHASDEFYILAGREVPEEERYDGYLQLENGVGMVRLQKTEFYEALNDGPRGLSKLLLKPYECTVVTGRLAYPYIREYAEAVMKKYKKIKIDVVAVRNDFFGERITVAGLLTGGDIIAQLKERGYSKNLLLPECMLKADDPVFLDDVRLSELESALQVKARVVKSNGKDLLYTMLGIGER